ncbi:MAG: helix-turn-helix domain-containing protein [bacterium]|nr:helix-turn-helix domain-containing protein [bacterium]
MNIGKVIRQYRKQQNLTQEQIANYLGVSAPAVNKWENDNSYPDITLLPPLARILKTDVDTLLSFHEELSDLEINQFIKEISSEVTIAGYEKTFDKAASKIKEYPTCDKLILFIAQIMNGYLMMGKDTLPGKKKYQKQITAWFEVVAESSSKELANMAITSLSQNYMNQKEYEAAQKLLDRIPPAGFDKRMMQANLYGNQGLHDKAYQVYEEMIYQYSNNLIGSLMQVINLLCEQEQYEKALQYAQLAETVADSFALGSYVGISARLPIFLKEKKVEESLQTLGEMIKGIDTMDRPLKSDLYRHMKFKESDGFDEMKQLLRKSIELDPELEFLKEDVRFQRIIKQL